MKSTKRILSLILAAVMIAGTASYTAVSTAAAVTDTSFSYGTVNTDVQIFSDEYKTSAFYDSLIKVIEQTQGQSSMEKTAEIALSQLGYKNYSTEGIDIEQAKRDGLLWTGIEKRMNRYDTGNTEYTRWAQRYVSDGSEASQYIDCDWCAIFTSWCMYQSGYYSEADLKKFYYSYCADPRNESEADTWIEAFNFEQENVWYTPLSNRKLEAYAGWNQYVHTDIDPYELPFRKGGLIFFSWDGSGKYFDHVAIVLNYDPQEHILRYINGNSDGEVLIREMDFDAEEEFHGQPMMKNADRVMAYAEYDEIKPLVQQEITADQRDIVWDINSSSGIKIQTNSKSKIVSVSENGNYIGSNIESNMLLYYGKAAIGKSELLPLGEGVHKLLLTFDDGSCEITLRIIDKEKTEIKLNKTAVNIGVKQKYTLTAEALPVAQNVTWSTDNKEIASVDKNGVVTGKKKGTAYITATAQDGTTAVCKVNVKKAPQSIELNRETLTIREKSTYTFTKTVTPNSAASYKWTSSNPDVARVYSNGKIVAQQKGTTVITVTTHNGKTASCTVTVI